MIDREIISNPRSENSVHLTLHAANVARSGVLRFSATRSLEAALSRGEPVQLRRRFIPLTLNLSPREEKLRERERERER